ncbi:hypothetical protein BDA96_02G334400 [Sorghum bicolor]|uniref:Uncharacterized protein n=1 Tax=Sorghum bicolor TaxID=4558 RepID=A0A921RSL7_SORBI|nr:hypothetical protein BDA96_02G334400 [Sorghum bicolor]
MIPSIIPQKYRPEREPGCRRRRTIKPAAAYITVEAHTSSQARQPTSCRKLTPREPLFPIPSPPPPPSSSPSLRCFAKRRRCCCCGRRRRSGTPRWTRWTRRRRGTSGRSTSSTRCWRRRAPGRRRW